MVKAKQYIDNIENGMYNDIFSVLYGENSIKKQQKRYIDAINNFINIYGIHREIDIFSAPGRTEIGGNHTDHQRGCILAASIDLDTICIVSKTENTIINLHSDGYASINIDISDVDVYPNEKNTSSSLVRGIAARMKELGYRTGGFDAYMISDIPEGSGLSSSAAFEVIIAQIFNSLFNDEIINSVELAQISQYAENVYFGKPCGLMDQIASSVGNLIYVDFIEPQKPLIEQANLNLRDLGHTLCIVDTGSSHSDLTEDYTSIRKEMESVAKELGHDVLRDIDENLFYRNIVGLREKAGDRAVLRAIHFFNENSRPINEFIAIKNDNFDKFLEMVRESGYSSFMYNQNVYSDSHEQSISIALAVSERVLSQRGAVRVHGGGFAGTIQAFIPDDLLYEYKEEMEKLFTTGCCHILRIRPEGSIKLRSC